MKDSSKCKVDARFRSFSFCIYSFPSTSLIYVLEARSNKQGQGCISYVLETPKRVCFSIFQFNWESLEEGLVGPRPNLNNSLSLAESVLIFTSSSSFSKISVFGTLSKGCKDAKISNNPLVPGIY